MFWKYLLRQWDRGDYELVHKVLYGQNENFFCVHTLLLKVHHEKPEKFVDELSFCMPTFLVHIQLFHKHTPHYLWTNWRSYVLIVVDKKSSHKKLFSSIKRHHSDLDNDQDILTYELGSTNSQLLKQFQSAA